MWLLAWTQTTDAHSNSWQVGVQKDLISFESWFIFSSPICFVLLPSTTISDLGTSKFSTAWSHHWHYIKLHYAPSMTSNFIFVFRHMSWEVLLNIYQHIPYGHVRIFHLPSFINLEEMHARKVIEGSYFASLWPKPFLVKELKYTFVRKLVVWCWCW
jgi:hypothetical protein